MPFFSQGNPHGYHIVPGRTMWLCQDSYRLKTLRCSPQPSIARSRGQLYFRDQSSCLFACRSKSDKISALRKQYEAFLEEDKRRKERNEYILGRLDEMRSCTSIVPQTKQSHVAHQASPLETSSHSERCVIPIRSATYTRYCQPQLPLATPAKCSEEAVLQEIVKKYILIPKRYYYNSNHGVDDNNDWQSKYEILNHLKNIEKEDKVPSHPDEDIVNNVRTPNNGAMVKREPIVEQELPVKDTYGNNLGVKIESQENTWEDDYKELKMTSNIDETGSPVKYAGIENKPNPDNYNVQNKMTPKGINKVTDLRKQDAISSGIHSLNVVSSTDKVEVPKNYDKPQTLHSKAAKQEPKPFLHVREDEQVTEEEKKSEEVSYSPIKTIHAQKVAREIVDHGNESKNYDDQEYPMEIINVSDFTPNVGLKLEDGVNINPEGYHLYEASGSEIYNNGNNGTIQSTIDGNVGYESNSENIQMQSTQNEVNVEQTENYEPRQAEINNEGIEGDFNEDQTVSEPIVVESTVDEAGIEEFEAEQRDMFYQEPPDDNAAYQQEAEAYNNVNYQQNEYQYYEGTQEGFPAEINEHEETTQLYDPNYEAQYGTGYQQQTQDYDQQQVYQQHLDGYEQQSGYEQQPLEYDQTRQPQQQEYVQQQQEYVQQQQQEYVEQQEYVQQEGYEQQQAYDEGQPYEQQHYDPQQLGYEQQTGYEQPIYDQQNNDQIQQIQQQQNYETTQNVEPKLDNEQGYVGVEQIEQENIIEEVKEKEALQNPS